MEFVPVLACPLHVSEPPGGFPDQDMAGSVADAARKQVRRYWLVSEHRST
ncbi:hypothetical protein Rhow_000532 [Rhodococcus wratislaviensis]|uniref:Uncharacterized protein n=1 Tax=Rhodococcus wratislaviensis TaxID=44752 RepID=A0A402CME2_RHOWR|nr:hypothetical protein Rhow_000532 [Rhodococcus wratislaviensis]